MDYQELKQAINSYSNRNLEQRKNWYSPAASAYNNARPRYPEELISQVIEIAKLKPSSKILELGCGPATATVSFAKLGLSMLCLEPNIDFYHLAQQNCQQYPNVEIQNTSFEEWILETEKFDVVLAASSFHWISPDMGYLKAANALQKEGFLILLWNKELQPDYATYQHLSKIYQSICPSLDRYEDRETQLKILTGLGQMVIESGQFKDLVSGNIESEVIYTGDEYLMLLDTYSPYLKLESKIKETLFKKLKNTIETEFDGSLKLSYLSAFHLAKKY